MQPDEVQARVTRNDATLMKGPSFLIKSRKVNPWEGVLKPSTPNHVGHIEHATIGEQGLPTTDTYDSGNALNSGRDQILGLDSDQRRRT